MRNFTVFSIHNGESMTQGKTADTGNRAPQQRINETIRYPQVRVISDEGEQLGVMSSYEALNMARANGLDLVEVSPDAKPPVCRVMDFGKFKYQQKKRQGKQTTHQSKLKELRLRPKTGDHDLLVKVNKAREFLVAKDRVILNVAFKGRELAHVDEGFKVIESIINQLEDISKIEAPAKHMGKKISCTLVPK